MTATAFSFSNRLCIILLVLCSTVPCGCGRTKKTLYLEKAQSIETECKTLQDVTFRLGTEPGYHATTKVSYFLPRDIALTRSNGWGEIATWIGDDCCITVRHNDGLINRIWITLPDSQ